MKVVDALKALEENQTDKVLKYIEDRPTEVFKYSDPDLLATFKDIREDTLNQYLYNLARGGKISKVRIDKHIYIGTKAAIDEFVSKLPSGKTAKR